MSTPGSTPPMAASNEADAAQLDVARAEGAAYRRALEAMRKKSGAVVKQAGQFIVALIQEDAEGVYAREDGHLVWHEVPEDANGHLEIAVADAGDGRFVPGLDITVTVSHDGRQVLNTRLPFLWHPFLHHYGANFVMPGEGNYDVQVHIDPPGFMRHDPVNGKRYGHPVEVSFLAVPFKPGRKPSPHAHPRAKDTPER
ncbi:Fe2+ transport protein [Saccharothrix carnea]|uniref:Fe2+ transport protein n=1 Tax=Saccharothrix carnea TaxID=1280637 RepID=A0A2P8IFZ5_SACCR|nr:iron transporter [Saccharothrix carnea]PSL57373.1 Fe2+ transport protein [Saccharothrix carnea]